ncbi:S8 family serine peptidase [Streptomyces hokutonensis]|uniref:S8 family serine peptidase n=1 Tax=Streptomyces hokutonensis TaxID=1306990 RepID=UPI00247FBB7C|nr:S8 family serine peptidase [Streptomyces hokutonensis]
MRAVSAVVGALAVVGVGFAPNAAADDVQSKQWYLDQMQAEKMWKVSTGKGVKVAVIDTGVNPDTPSLKGQVLVDEVPKAVSYHSTVDFDGHGTSMAELIAGTGAGGSLKGLAPGAKIVPYRVDLKGLKVGSAEQKKTPEPWQAIRAAADTDAQIISMSIGGYVSTEEEEAVKYAASKGKLMIAAVGNSGTGTGDGNVDYPAAYPYVIGIAAVDSSFTVTKFSAYGNYVDLAAPGTGIPGWCDATFHTYCDTGGTSQATAIASASAALIWSAHPDWTVNQVTRSLIDTASRTWAENDPSKYAGYGFVRPRVVLENAKYDAGAPNVDPLAKENGGNLLAKSASSSSSTASTPSASATSKNPGKGSTGGTSAAGSTAKSSNDSNTLWIALGGAAAVLVIGGAGVAVARARRAR